MSKLGESVGVWNIKVSGADINVMPRVGDNRKFRRVVMNDQNKKDKAGMFEKFEDMLVAMIVRDNPADPDLKEIKVREYVEFNSNELFEETMVKFKWSTKEELEKSRKEALGDLKKLTEDG